MESAPANAIGMVWYLAEDFDEIQAMMGDGHGLHRTYAEWKTAAEAGEKRVSTNGGRVYRAIIRPAEFRAWCEARGVKLDANARNDFASQFAAQEYRAGR
jgi:hypothetical protein